MKPSEWEAEYIYLPHRIGTGLIRCRLVSRPEVWGQSDTPERAFDNLATMFCQDGREIYVAGTENNRRFC